ncbi:MAG: phosphohexomutase domain-containing protein [Thermoguttaceae bacterium]
MSVYKPCDIRGHVPTDLNNDLYRCWGRSLGLMQPGAGKFVIGGDVRFSTPAFLDALAEGLVSSGVDVVDLGIVPTPMVYYAKRRLQAEGCAIVTASHNPPDHNGLKWMVGDSAPTPEQVERLRHEAQNGCGRESVTGSGSRRALDISHDYVAWLQETWFEARDAEATIVLDPMHGCWSRRARRFLQAVYPRVVFVTVRDEPDAVFCGDVPDCSRPDRIEPLSEAVEHQRAHLGIAFDGDGDRIALVDDRGVPLTAEEATWILLESFGNALADEKFVYDLKFSDRLPRRAEEMGAEPIAERSGHAFIRSCMLQSGAVFGAEVSGHYFFRALGGGDDGLFAACWIIDFLAHSGRSLSELRQSCPPVHLTPDLRIPIDPDEGRAVIERVRSVWAEYPQHTTDGVRIEFPDGWALVRQSVTEPALTFRFESTSDDELAILVKRFCDALPEVGDDLWFEFEISDRNG